MDLLNNVRARFAKRRTSALENYSAIVGRYDAPRRGDEDALAAAMSELGIGPEELAEDIEAVKSYRRTQDSIVSDERLAELVQLENSATQEFARIERESEQAVFEARGRANQAAADSNAAAQRNYTARERLAALRASNPRAFGLAPADPAPAATV